MANIAKRPNGQWRARYRDAAGKEHSRHFGRKVDAQRWLDGVTASVVRGDYIDPKAGRVTVREYAGAWQSAQVVRETTAANVSSVLSRHVLPILGDRPLAQVRHSEVQGMVRALSDTLAPGSVAQVFKVTKRMFAAAVLDRTIASSPCVGVKLPTDHRPDVTPPTVVQVGALVDATEERYRAAVVLLAGSGLRIAELLGLRLEDVDFLRRTVKVERQRLRSGGVGPPKTRKSQRTVPLGQVVIDALAAHLTTFPSEEWLFTDRLGRPTMYHQWQDVWGAARQAAGIDLDTHALRHFYASALINGGASVKVVQERLGHGSAAFTLNTYSHLWPDDDELTRTVMDAAFAPLADSLRTEAAAER